MLLDFLLPFPWDLEPPKQCLSSLINNLKSMHNYANNKNQHCKQVIFGIHMNNNIIIHKV